jgi:N-acetylglucosamine-6-sulfatase
MTDDQRWDTLSVLPNVQADLVSRGVTFSNAYVVNTLCCPSRTSTLTGEYSHSTGVYTNGGPHGGFHVFADGSTLATWLHGAGYHTALVGKYLNGYGGTYIPPGWDDWVSFSDEELYYDYTLNENGVLNSYGSAPADYSTDVLAARADQFIRTTTGPLFLFFAAHAPHGPATPAPRHANTFNDLPPNRPPNFNEGDVSDKPRWVQDLPRFTADIVNNIDSSRKDAYRSLLAVDDAVGTIVQALADTGRLRDTLIVFTSDNGLAFGEHRWRGKEVPYEESIRVPLVVRYDPITTTAAIDKQLVLNIDFAPTFAQLAGVTPPSSVEGRSFLPLLSSPNARWRGSFLVEHFQGVSDPVPTYCQVHTKRYSYVDYGTGEEELYDLKTDPYELTNRAGDPQLAGKLDALRALRQKLCDPPPPGFTAP